MTEKVKLTREQADAVDSLLENIKGMRFTELFKAIQYGYEIKSEYKVGEWVVFVTVTGNSYVGKVEGVEGGGILRTDIYAKAVVKQWFDKESLRYATPEEIIVEKERRMWKSINRKVGEFLPNDVVVYKDDSVRFVSTGDKGLGFNEVKPTLARDNYFRNQLKAFYPADTFISFESNDTTILNG